MLTRKRSMGKEITLWSRVHGLHDLLFHFSCVCVRGSLRVSASRKESMSIHNMNQVTSLFPGSDLRVPHKC